MNYIYLILFFNILSAFSYNTKPNLCIDCKFFTKEFLKDNKYGKCLVFPIENLSKDYLIDGTKNTEQTEYFFCSTARSSERMCGEDGKHFEKK